MPTSIPDFDELATLAKHNPEQFEKLRTELCEKVISAAPESQQRRLRGIQFQIDMERRKAATPMAACVRISELMHESFEELRYHLNKATGVQSTVPVRRAARYTRKEETTEQTGVIDFPVR